MLVGLMSDTHDRIPAIAELLKRMTDRGVGMVLHAGDFCSPFSLKPFQDSNVALAGVFGRNDGDPSATERSSTTTTALGDPGASPTVDPETSDDPALHAATQSAPCTRSSPRSSRQRRRRTTS